MTTLYTLGRAWSRRKAKYSPASWRWSALLNRKPLGRSSAWGSMVEKSTFLTSSRVICRKKEFDENSLADTHRSRTVWPSGRIGHRGGGTHNAWGEAYAEILLGRSGSDGRLPIEPIIYKWRSVTTWAVFCLSCMVQRPSDGDGDRQQRAMETKERTETLDTPRNCRQEDEERKRERQKERYKYTEKK